MWDMHCLIGGGASTKARSAVLPGMLPPAGGLLQPTLHTSCQRLQKAPHPARNLTRLGLELTDSVDRGFW